MEKRSARKPHVEDVYVMAQRCLQPVSDLRALVLSKLTPWQGHPSALYGGAVHSTQAGSAYVPEHGPLPSCSTGYWQPDRPLRARSGQSGTRFEYSEDTRRWRIKWVGTASPPGDIDAGSLVRVSLSRLFSREDVPSGYYVQISGVL
jgi:hypothetical protein